ncbi:ead/Ea22-like family protein [Enterobacter hormaechei]|uniref:Ead/Ea22-like family protein n=1 Tax=Enterobacter phage vB_EclS_CobraSix TaxID=2894794 RepID=A0AAE8YQJ3_9CAUD|nr:ead/Ea22-like family protein [Enterobacter hormaechei]YP_010675409.1 hypothetical protein PQD12_gp61 [Enterobacter phage vB_EclS_CobraSix]KAF0679422.1 hypothetical protein Y59_27840 [Enterobacter hormaechei]UGO47228.1 hypothetical protein COBRASIX_63 [Enterobacter phage vB_EclS_CobraSix]
MSNIDKSSLAKTRELATLMVERISMNPVSCKLLNEAWKKEFPDEVAIADRMLALLDELESETSYREGAFIACNRWHDKFRESEAKLEAAEKRIAELEERMVKLPERYEVDMCPTPSPNGEWFSREDVLAALVSADVSYAAVNGKGE